MDKGMSYYVRVVATERACYINIVWYLLVNGIWRKDSPRCAVRMIKASLGDHVPIKNMAEILRNAGYTVDANCRAKRFCRKVKFLLSQCYV
jgi:hypothetical protein